MIEFDLIKEKNKLGKASIKVIGVGGAGGNTVNSMIENGGSESGIDFIVANTDSQALSLSKASHKIQLGVKSTKGLGAGADPEVGRRAAEEDLDKLLEMVGDADIVFLAAGMGGGTGSGSSPVIARALRERNILTVAVVTKPFMFEGRRRARIAQEAIKSLRMDVDTLLVVPNEKLLEVAEDGISMIDAFSMVNNVLDQSVCGISNIISKPGHINVDFADLRAIMRDMGMAVMGSGKASGEQRAREAALAAISSPLLENMSIKGAKGVLLNITGGLSLGLNEINQAASVIYDQADEDANIILGSVIDDSLSDEIVVTIVATGFDEVRREEQRSPKIVFEKKTPGPIKVEMSPAKEPAVQEVKMEPVLEKPKYVEPVKVEAKPELEPVVNMQSSELFVDDEDCCDGGSDSSSDSCNENNSGSCDESEPGSCEVTCACGSGSCNGGCNKKEASAKEEKSSYVVDSPLGMQPMDMEPVQEYVFSKAFQELEKEELALKAKEEADLKAKELAEKAKAEALKLVEQKEAELKAAAKEEARLELAQKEAELNAKAEAAAKALEQEEAALKAKEAELKLALQKEAELKAKEDALKAEELELKAKEEEAAEEVKVVNINDLDVPTFLRNKAKAEQKDS